MKKRHDLLKDRS